MPELSMDDILADHNALDFKVRYIVYGHVDLPTGRKSLTREDSFSSQTSDAALDDAFSYYVRMLLKYDDPRIVFVRMELRLKEGSVPPDLKAVANVLRRSHPEAKSWKE